MIGIDETFGNDFCGIGDGFKEYYMDDDVKKLKRELERKDREIEMLKKELAKYTTKKSVGRPSIYGEYYELIENLYSQYKSATVVADILHKRDIKISVRQVNNIVKKLNERNN